MSGGARQDLLPTAAELRKLSKRAIVDYVLKCFGLVADLRGAYARENRRPETLENAFRDLPEASDESLQQMLQQETASSMALKVSEFLAEAAIYAFVDGFHAHLLNIDPEESLDRTISAARAAASCALAATGLAAKRKVSDSDGDVSDSDNLTRAEAACNIARQDFIAKVRTEYQLLLDKELMQGGNLFVN